MSTVSISRPVRTAAAWLSAAVGAALAIIASSFPGQIGLPWVSSDHVTALIPVLLLPLGLHGLGRMATPGGRAGRFARHWQGLSLPTRIAGVLLLAGALVHLALLPGHLVMESQTGVLFALDVAGFAGALALTVGTRHWRIPAGLVALLTVVAYGYYVQTGLESADLVGALTSAAEIAVIPVALFDWVTRTDRRPGRQAVAIAVAVLVAFVSTSTVAHALGGTSSLADALARFMPSPSASMTMGGATPASLPSTGNGNMSNGTMAGGAMAGGEAGATMTNSVCPTVGAMATSSGMLMQPVPSTPPTQAQVAATNQLVAQTTSGIAQYADVNVAIAAGYTAATRTDIPVVHMINRKDFSNTPLANPAAPQALVYAHKGSTWVLLGAMFMTDAQCKEGPDIGGSLTDWHAHANLCFGAGGTVTGNHPDAAGQCPAGETTHATPFMLHVYTVANNTSGPFELSNSAIGAALRG